MRKIHPFRNRPHTLDQPDSEPRDRPDDDQQDHNRHQRSCQATASAKHARHSLKDGIERDREHRAPDDDRNERLDEDQSYNFV